MRKLLARKRVPRTNGRRIRFVYRAGEQATRRDNSFLDYTERKRERHFSLTFSTTHTLVTPREKQTQIEQKPHSFHAKHKKKTDTFAKRSLCHESVAFSVFSVVAFVLRVLSSLVVFIVKSIKIIIDNFEAYLLDNFEAFLLARKVKLFSLVFSLFERKSTRSSREKHRLRKSHDGKRRKRRVRRG